MAEAERIEREIKNFSALMKSKRRNQRRNKLSAPNETKNAFLRKAKRIADEMNS